MHKVEFSWTKVCYKAEIAAPETSAWIKRVLCKKLKREREMKSKASRMRRPFSVQLPVELLKWILGKNDLVLFSLSNNNLKELLENPAKVPKNPGKMLQNPTKWPQNSLKLLQILAKLLQNPAKLLQNPAKLPQNLWNCVKFWLSLLSFFCLNDINLEFPCWYAKQSQTSLVEKCCNMTRYGTIIWDTEIEIWQQGKMLTWLLLHSSCSNKLSFD